LDLREHSRLRAAEAESWGFLKVYLSRDRQHDAARESIRPIGRCSAYAAASQFILPRFCAGGDALVEALLAQNNFNMPQ
jgi:hypothetical protein